MGRIAIRRNSARSESHRRLKTRGHIRTWGGPLRPAEGEVLGVRPSWSAVRDPGLVRTRDEDSVLAQPVVADCMGDPSAGDVASGTNCR